MNKQSRLKSSEYASEASTALDSEGANEHVCVLCVVCCVLCVVCCGLDAPFPRPPFPYPVETSVWHTFLAMNALFPTPVNSVVPLQSITF